MEKDDDDETEEVVLSRVSLDVNKLTAPVERESEKESVKLDCEGSHCEKANLAGWRLSGKFE